MTETPETQNGTQTETQKKSGWGCWLPIAVVAILAAGGAAAYYYLTPGSRATPLETAEVVPDEAILAAYVTTDEATWGQLRQFGTPEAQKIVTEQLNAVRQDILSETNVDFDKDLKPWLGDVMVAVLPSENPEATEDEAFDILTVVNIKDKIKALNFSRRVKEQEGAEIAESNYKGVTISQVTEANGTTYSLAVLGDRLALSFQDPTLRAAIDTFKGEASLASQPEAEALLEEGVDLDTPLAQVYILDYAALVQQSIAASEEEATISPEALQQLQQIESMVYGVGIADLGVQVRGVAIAAPDADLGRFPNASGEIVSQFPADTLALVSGAGVSDIWNQIVERSSASPDSQGAIAIFRGALSSVGLTDSEIFGWMDGEFAIGVIPSPQGFAQTGLGGAIIIETSDRAAATAALEKLQNLAQSNTPLPINISDRDLEGTTVTDWTVPQAVPGPLLSYGWIEEDTVFVALGGLAEMVVGDPETALDNGELFARITDILPDANAGYVYVNGQQALQLMQMAGQTGQIPPDVMAGFSSIDGWAATIAMPDPTEIRFDLAIDLVENGQ